MTRKRAAIHERTIPFTAGDGLELNLINLRGERAPSKGPVLLVHGAGVRANLFRAPIERSLIDELIDEGYDVWLENWRASIDLAPNPWNLDLAAAHDHPAAVRKVIEETGASSLQAIVHCQGSTSFAMSAAAGLVPQVRTIVTNAVSLHPVVPDWSRFKLRYAVPLVRKVLPYLNPRWGDRAPGLFPKLLTTLVRATHHECDNDVCKMISFTYGAGFPALWRHENLNAETHDTFIRKEFGHVPLRFFAQMARCVRAGQLVRVDESLQTLPAAFAAQPPKTDARWSFFAGEENLCFLAESQVRTHRWMQQVCPGDHTLHVIPGYGHLDIFLGKRAAQDVYPLILDELARKEKPRSAGDHHAA